MSPPTRSRERKPSRNHSPCKRSPSSVALILSLPKEVSASSVSLLPSRWPNVLSIRKVPSWPSTVVVTVPVFPTTNSTGVSYEPPGISITTFQRPPRLGRAFFSSATADTRQKPTRMITFNGFALRIIDPAWRQSVPPAVAVGQSFGVKINSNIARLISNPPATAGGTDCLQQRCPTLCAKPLSTINSRVRPLRQTFLLAEDAPRSR